MALVVKHLPANAGGVRDAGLGRSPEVGHGSSLQYSCVENPIDRGCKKLTCLKQLSM